MKCNTLEIPSPRCRRIFNLPLGHVAVHPHLCVTGWTNLNNVCTYPAKSKRVGMRCESDADCITTDPTGKTGTCYCKDWWDSGHSKYCLPVAGDYDNKMEKVLLFYSCMTAQLWLGLSANGLRRWFSPKLWI